MAFLEAKIPEIWTQPTDRVFIILYIKDSPKKNFYTEASYKYIKEHCKKYLNTQDGKGVNIFQNMLHLYSTPSLVIFF
jgi:hypothetical protein